MDEAPHEREVLLVERRAQIDREEARGDRASVLVADRAVGGLDQLVDLELDRAAGHEPDEEERDGRRDPDRERRLEDRAGYRVAPHPAEVSPWVPVHTDRLRRDRDRGHVERLPPGRATELGEKPREREVAERGEHEIGRGEIEAGGDRVRHRDAAQAGGLRRGHAVRRVFKGERFTGCHPQIGERTEVEVRSRLSSRDVVAADDRGDAFTKRQPLEVRADVTLAGARGDTDPESESRGIREVLPHAGDGLERREDLALPRLSSRFDRDAIERRRHQRREVVERVERPDRRTDVLEPPLAGKLEPMIAVDLGPRLERGTLGLEDQPVEIEDERADGSGRAQRRRSRESRRRISRYSQTSVTRRPNAPYHSMYFGARAATPRSTKSKSRRRLNAAITMTTRLTPMPRRPDPLIASFRYATWTPRRLRTKSARYTSATPPVAATIPMRSRSVTTITCDR